MCLFHKILIINLYNNKNLNSCCYKLLHLDHLLRWPSINYFIVKELKKERSKPDVFCQQMRRDEMERRTSISDEKRWEGSSAVDQSLIKNIKLFISFQAAWTKLKCLRCHDWIQTQTSFNFSNLCNPQDAAVSVC